MVDLLRLVERFGVPRDLNFRLLVFSFWFVFPFRLLSGVWSVPAEVPRWWFACWSGTTTCPSSGGRTSFLAQVSRAPFWSQRPTSTPSIMPWPKLTRRIRWSWVFSPPFFWRRSTSWRLRARPSTCATRSLLVLPVFVRGAHLARFAALFRFFHRVSNELCPF